MPRRILSVSYGQQLLTTRQWLLEQAGYDVTSALGLAEAVSGCQQDSFDLFILGHSIPAGDKNMLIETFRRTCAAPVLSLRRLGDAVVTGADHQVYSESPKALLEAVATIFAKGDGSGETKAETKAPPKPAPRSYTVFSAASKSNQEKGDRRR